VIRGGGDGRRPRIERIGEGKRSELEMNAPVQLNMSVGIKTSRPTKPSVTTAAKNFSVASIAISILEVDQ
jgi:hypothetical protein